MKTSYSVTLKYEVEVRIDASNVAGATVVLKTCVDALSAEEAKDVAGNIAYDKFDLQAKLSVTLVKIKVWEAE